jgi:tetratricopeptide (TPR) repeat protein
MNRKQRRAAEKQTAAPAPTLATLFADALRHHQSGRLNEAEGLYRQILAGDPRHADSLHLLGLIAYQVRRYDLAVELIGKAIAIDPGQAVFHFNLAIAFQAEGRPDDAAAGYRRAIGLNPDYLEAHANLGGILKDQGNLNDAALNYRRVVDLQPANAEAQNILGGALHQLGRLEEAAACYRQALGVKPDHALAHNNLGLVLQDQGRVEDAIAEYRVAACLAPDPAIRWNLALAQLQNGEYAAGWRDHEWCYGTALFARREFSAPAWTGESIEGQTILLYADQGRGDAIQFIRYAPRVKARGATVILECQPELANLFETAPGIDRVIAKGESAPPFDFHAALRSLPHLFGATLDTIPAGAPYLNARDGLVAAWRARLTSPGPNIGLVWRGNPSHVHDRKRSVAAELFAELCAVPGVNWLSLQKEARPEEIAALSRHGEIQANIRDCGPLLTDWAETAALASCLNLIVTVDTGVAHLAGALGRPAWVLLPFNPDWRWLLHRRDSPWHPTLRLFRQPAPGDWGAVFRALRQELEDALKTQPIPNFALA